MRLLILAATLFVPLAAHAQQPPPISAPAAFAAVLAQNLATALAENDALRAEVAKLRAAAADKDKGAPIQPKQ